MKMLCFNAGLRQFIGAVVLFFCCIDPSFGQPLLYSVQQRLAMASSLRSEGVHPFSMAINPADLASCNSIGWGLGGEQRFLVPGWMEVAAAGVLPIREGVWGICVGQEGLPFSFDQLLMVTHAKKILEHVALGATIGVNRKKAAGRSASWIPVAALGVSVPLSTELKVAISYMRFSSSAFKAQGSGAPSFLRCLLGYEPTEKVNLVAAISKESSWPAAGFFSVQYRPDKKIGFSAGYSGFPTMCWIGFRLGVGASAVVQLYSGFYPLTGLSNGMSLFKSADLKKDNGP